MANNTMDQEKLRTFATAFRAGNAEGAEEIAAYLAKQGKKAHQTAVEIPELLFFMADRALIPTGEVDGYLLDVSWIEHPDVIEKLLRYKKNPPKTQLEADAEKEAAAAGDPKNDWMTEKLPDGTLRLVSYKGTSTEIVVPTKIGKATVSTIGAHAFTPNKPRLKKEMSEIRRKIQSVVIPEGIAIDRAPDEGWSYIGNFEGCEKLKTIHLPDGLKKLPKGMFRRSGISEIVLPDFLETIEKEAFAECSKLKSIRFPTHLKELQGDLFQRSALEEFSWPENDGTTTLPSGMFTWCVKLKKVELPNNLTKIDAWAFTGCTKLAELTLPNTVREIERSAFSNCQSLVELHIPDGVRVIKEDTFNTCKKLSRLYLPASIENIEPGKRARHIDSRTFGDCEKLVICAPAGSYAETFAKANGIPFAAV